MIRAKPSGAKSGEERSAEERKAGRNRAQASRFDLVRDGKHAGSGGGREKGQSEAVAVGGWLRACLQGEPMDAAV